MEEIVIMDFSGIYEDEQFWREEKVSWIDLKGISGTNCYCDEAARSQILEKLDQFLPGGIYFIDSGNYHYMSRIGIERVTQTFRLLVFDNHTDMQLPAFGGLLSCGGWIASAIEESQNLAEVWLVGPDEEAYSQVEEELKGKVRFISQGDAEASGYVREIPTDLPLYISIDKDVLCGEDASTTWSQGSMKLSGLIEILGLLLESFQEKGGEILQVDICGECDVNESSDNDKNDRANKRLLDFWKEARQMKGIDL